ncbi:hypothetical protein DEO72_LG8g3028 [Vigna unguiculata]|uniref:Uncharacterized protein n=1 Tax=Vigna unguiculata TaxID=3917 RepID=A0A4D6MU19_VIGUN|nr:hypothetical protein DEO72_LG8g3028 [Vigna unguiculata]
MHHLTILLLALSPSISTVLRGFPGKAYALNLPWKSKLGAGIAMLHLPPHLSSYATRVGAFNPAMVP